MPDDQKQNSTTEKDAVLDKVVDPQQVQEPVEVKVDEPVADLGTEKTPVSEQPEETKEPEEVNPPAGGEEERVAESQPQPEPAPVSQPAQQPVSSAPASSTDTNIIQKLLVKARAKIQSRKQKRLDKIISTLQVKGRLTNKEIMNLVKKSSYTAIRYMDILEKQGKVRQVGKTGRSVYYELVK